MQCREILGEQLFFKDLDERSLNTLAECASTKQFGSGAFIFRQNQNADAFYIILKGKVDVELFSVNGGPVVLQSLEKGDVLGWSWLTPPYYWRMDARSVADTELIVLDAIRLRQKMEADHNFGYEVLKRFLLVVTQRLEAARLELLSLYGTHT